MDEIMNDPALEIAGMQPEMPVDPLAMLKQDHDHVKANFEKFEDARDEEKYSLFVDTVLSLVVHTKLEEELIYPLLSEHGEGEEEKDMKNEAEEEHRVVDFVITEMKTMNQDDEKFDAKFKVLSELVKHHIEEEENEMFPMLRGMEIDFADLQEQMVERKAELEEQYADLDSVEPLESPVTKGHRKQTGRKRTARQRASSGAKARSGSKATRKSAGSAKSSSKSKAKSSNSKSKTGTRKATGKTKSSSRSAGSSTRKKTASNKTSSKRSTTKKAGTTKRSGGNTKSSGGSTTKRAGTARSSSNKSGGSKKATGSKRSTGSTKSRGR